MEKQISSICIGGGKMTNLNDFKEVSIDYVSCIKSSDYIEFKASVNGNLFEGIISRGIHYNWIAFPSRHVSCQLASFSDSFWNREHLEEIFNNQYDVNNVLLIIDELTPLFNQDRQSYFNGQKYMSKNEYIFWLENQCEILSAQMVILEIEIEKLEGRNDSYQRKKERDDYHDIMRFQSDDTIFE